MLELGAGADILRLLARVHLLIIIALVILALWLPRRWWQKILAATAVILVFTLPAYQRGKEQEKLIAERKARYEQAKALFDERCKTAGEKIYRVVENVDGILLKNTRGERKISNFDDQYWDGAGFQSDSQGINYIMGFLYYRTPDGELHPPGKSPGKYGGRNFVTEFPGGTLGYLYVDVGEREGRMRYRLRPDNEYVIEEPLKAYGIRTLATDLPPRYAVVYKSIDDPQGRASWIAGGRVQVIDQQTGEILGESVRYAFERGFGNTHGYRSPWRFAEMCPSPGGNGSRTIRAFVERVIKPTQER